MQDWRVFSKKADFSALGQQFGIDPVVARIIRNRDVEGAEMMERFLHGSLKDLHSPFLLKDMDKAVSLLKASIANGEKIRIIGDYDIDGICSIYILFQGLKLLGARVDYEVPHRITDGYGINENLIKEAADAGREVIITCDNGIAALTQIAYAKELGLKVIVTDHHDVQYEETQSGKQYMLPPADAVVNPKQQDCSYPFKSICGAMVAFKLIQAMCEVEGIQPDAIDSLIQFAAIATVGDIMDLMDENRILVKEGLKRLAVTDNLGLDALMNITGVKREALSTYHLGFVIGPCLNASGRLDSAKRALTMLLSKDHKEAYVHAEELKSLNDERKKLTEEAVQAAFLQIDGSVQKEDVVLVVYLPDCHESIAGIVAGKVRERYYRPCVVLTKAEEGAKGSGRSIEGYHMFEKLKQCEHLLTKYGGHPMAAGLSLPIEHIPLLRQALNEKADLSEEVLREKVWIDVPVPVDYLSEALVDELKLLEPFGKGNPKPVFADRHLLIRDYQIIGKNKNVTRMTLVNESGTVIDGIAFFTSEELGAVYQNGTLISCTYQPEINAFGGRKKLQISINGYKIENNE